MSECPFKIDRQAITDNPTSVYEYVGCALLNSNKENNHFDKCVGEDKCPIFNKDVE